jgi:hypothetical protein
LKIVTWNANGILGKLNELKVFLKLHDVDIMAITETKLLKSDKLLIKGYSIMRKERNTDTRGGGVAIFVKRGIPYSKAQLPANEVECTAIKLSNNITVVAVYNRPVSKFKRNSLGKIYSAHNNLIIAGDLNSKHTDWGNNYNNMNGTTLKNFIDSNNIDINYPTDHTHHPSNNSNPSTIDFFLMKNITNYTAATTIHDLPSDHYPVEMLIKDVPRQNLDKFITSYKNTNWKSFRETLDSLIETNPNIKTIEELDAEIVKFTTALLRARDKHAKTLKANPDKSDIPSEIIEIIKDRNKARKKYQRTGNNNYKYQFQNLNRVIKTELANHKNAQWDKLLRNAKTNDNTLWKLASSRTKKRSEIPPITDSNNIEAISDEQKTECLASYFQGVHNNSTASNPKQLKIEAIINKTINRQTNLNHEYIKNVITNPREVGGILHKLKNNKATGEDSVDNVVIKRMSRKAKVQLTYLINGALKLNYFPKQYKNSIVIPIPKTGKNPKKVESYRPISLLNSISKILEKIIHRRLKDQLADHNIDQECQFGFKTYHSTTHQLARICNDVLINFNKDKNTVLTLLDLEKAFDRVWIKGLLYKMHVAGINPNFIKLLNSYLTNRRIKVKINNELSSEKLIEAGVPQGSVLGPSLFNFYIHDTPEFFKTNLALYADDKAIYAHSYYAQAALLQNQLHINLLSQYFEDWKLKLNEPKTELIIFTRKKTNIKIFTPLKINKHKINPTTKVNYLGITLDARLNFKENVKTKLVKANNAIRKIYPLIKRNSKLNVKNKIIIYKALLRPIVTYAAPVWSHLSDYALQPLEVFQNKCLRLIHNAPRYTNTQYLRDISELPTIKNFILAQAEKFFHKNSIQLIKTPNDNELNKLNINRTKHKLIHQHIL